MEAEMVVIVKVKVKVGSFIAGGCGDVAIKFGV